MTVFESTFCCFKYWLKVKVPEIAAVYCMVILRSIQWEHTDCII